METLKELFASLPYISEELCDEHDEILEQVEACENTLTHAAAVVEAAIERCKS
jgi:hypothetical protein